MRGGGWGEGNEGETASQAGWGQHVKRVEFPLVLTNTLNYLTFKLNLYISTFK